ncbi:MAG: CDP-alcohol phosphatidyltransferase family protein [Sedimentisphaerales bacterium]|nr:CDP-alcohol phosphatidyltransferase family protein [Sedimentisphaerales bacterium]
MSQSHKADRSAIFSRIIGGSIIRARDWIARGLIQLHINPNVLTCLGLAITLISTLFLAWGAGDKPGKFAPGQSWYGVIGALLIIGASAMDILDGAVAHLGSHITQLGGFLDSCLDRIADGAIFFGITIYYLNHTQINHHKVFALAAIVALINAEIISYLKARAENFIESCPVGYWQRGERIAAILIGLFCGHMGTVVVMLAILPGFTVLRRLIFGCRQIARSEQNRPLLDPQARQTGLMRLALWRYPRRSVQYDIITAFNICIILFIDLQNRI